jgi:hypothetical protein
MTFSNNDIITTAWGNYKSIPRVIKPNSEEPLCICWETEQMQHTHFLKMMSVVKSDLNFVMNGGQDWRNTRLWNLKLHLRQLLELAQIHYLPINSCNHTCEKCGDPAYYYTDTNEFLCPNCYWYYYANHS